MRNTFFKTGFFFLLLSITQHSFGQSYTPLDTANYLDRKVESTNYTNISKTYIDEARKELSGSVKSALKKRYKYIDQYFTEDILKGNYLFKTDFNRFVDSLMSELVAKNPTLPSNLHLYVSRNISLNASSLGNKCFTVNMGGFIYLENEGQIASLIAHELAHYVLQHHIKDLTYQVSLKKDDDLDDEIYDIENSKYNVGKKAFDKMKSLLYAEGKMNKQQEYEADSLGYVLYKNAQFHPVDYIGSMRLMAEYDTIRPYGLADSTYQKAFNLPTYPFKAEWLKMEDFSTYDYSKYKEKFNQDSLKSHPETEDRINYLIKNFPELKENTKTKFKAINSFKTLKERAQYEMFPTLLYQEDYGIGLYFCLIILQEDGLDDFVKEWMGKYLTKIYEARKSYTLNRYLQRVNPRDQSISYQRYLSFMWNLSLGDLKTFADFYSAKKGS